MITTAGKEDDAVWGQQLRAILEELDRRAREQ